MLLVGLKSKSRLCLQDSVSVPIYLILCEKLADIIVNSVGLDVG